ncbi:nacht domain protein [Colletotrichum truncatum]|uniref:Nacht domain protein n=1 Tax=Colletotrichum truncatum TaxID=5467 RepID=A0ACC3YFD8_COLTU|nr:nacht domain protein [Colletotrichum truncatum]KAF6788297.1 nacht domain protein [Colletotrichum truncatum]
MATSSQASLNKHIIKEEARTNGYEVNGNDSASISSNEAVTTIQSASQSTTQSSRTTVYVSETARVVRRKIIRELEDVTTTYFERVDLEAYLEFIGEERLLHMPRKGSQWDRVLKEAEFFGIQLHEFSHCLRKIIPEWSDVRNTALASCYILLELGCEQAEALEPTFNTFYELGLLLSHSIQLHDMFTASDAIKHDLSCVFDSLVRLVGDVALFYRQRINRIYSGSVTIDFDAEFGTQIAEIWSRKEHLFNHMWEYKLRSKRLSLDIATLRQHLLPSRESVKSFVYGRVADRKLRVEGTCEWIEHDLHSFLRSDDDIFTITGNEGCGKSLLAAWVRERLERPFDRQQFETISFTFSSDIPEEASPLALLKSLLSQLLEVNVGDVALFERLAVIFDRRPPGEDTVKLESDLWDALKLSIDAINNKKTNLVMIIDGLDEINGGAQKASELHKKLHDAIIKHNRIQAITFSRPISHLGGNRCKHLVITPEHVRDDIEVFLTSKLKRITAFASENDQAKRDLINKLADQAKGSFLFAYLAVNLLSTGLNFNTFKDTMAHCKSDVKAVMAELIKKVNIKEEYGESKTYNLFIFMLAARRPLTTGEMTDLMSISLSKRTVSANADIWQPIRNTQGLVVVHRGTLRFKHSVVRKYINSLCGTTLMSVEDSHRHLTLALMLFAKTKFTQSSEPTLEWLSDDLVHECLHSHHIARYMLHNWVYHFRMSSLHGQKDKLSLTPEFKEVFPDTTFFSLLEWSHWQSQFSLKETIAMQELSLRIRSSCFGEKHRSYLQNLIVLGSLHRRTSEPVSASEFFYKASCVGQVILYKFSPLVISCTNLFLTCTEKITITKRTTTVTYREEMIRFMIEICKNKNGKQSDDVIKWYKVLAKLYVDIKEEETAMEIYRELHVIVIARFGKGSKMECEIAEDVSGMSVVLQSKPGKPKGFKHAGLLFDAAEEMSHTDIRRIKIILTLARTYEAEHQYVMTERLYVGLWRSILEACRLKATVELHLEKLNIALEYIQFLRRIKRTEEACNIMVCLWAEYDNYKFESETLVIRFKELAILAKSFGIIDISMSILSKVWGYFKSKKTIEHEEAISTSVIITEVVEEITETIVETKTTTTVVETVTREVWETTYERCKTGKASKGFFSSCLALIKLYLKQENWTEAETILRKTLEVTWKGVLTADAKLTIEGEFISERILVARRLALCYHKQRQFTKAEEIYLRIFNACFHSLHVENHSVLEAAVTLVEFYEEYHRHEKVIDIYNKLLQHYRKHLKRDHQLTIQTLYKLAAVYLKLGRNEAYECYSEIVSIYTHDGCCHAGGLEAGVIVLNHYYLEKRWAELQKICTTLWTTFIHHHHEIKFTEEMVEVIYQRYRYVLEFHAKVEFTALYKLTVEYRETVTKVFGVSSAIVLKAMIALAEICEGSETHYHESITIYEEVLTRTKTTTTVSETTVRTMKKRLSKLYVTVITTGKVTTTTTIERAIAIGIEMYEQLRIEYGWWHETTLLKLREVTLLYKKLGTKESHFAIVQMLQASVIEIITTVTVSTTLHVAAKTLAEIYIAAGMVRHGNDLLRQLRYVLLFPGFEGGEKDVTIKLSHNVTKVSLVFLISFEQALHIDGPVKYNFSEIMADVLLETILYEQYMSVMSSYTETSSFEIVVEHAARLRFVWESRGRTGFVNVLDKKLFALFTSRYSKHLGNNTANSQAISDFYVGLLREIGAGIASERDSIDFSFVTCKAAYTTTKRFMKEREFSRAHEVAKCAFGFANSQRFYHYSRNNVWGYRLAELLAGIGVDGWKSADAGVREASLATSRNVLQLVLSALRESKIEFSNMRPEDIKSLIYLLGEQKNFTELENLLVLLWQSREVQRGSGLPDRVLNIGSLLVDAHLSAGHIDQAVTLCDTLYYNVRQSRGGLDPQALELANRLCHLLCRANRVREAARVHQDVVCDLDEHLLATRGADKEERLRVAAETHLDGMRRCGWASRGDSVRTTKEVYERLKAYGKLNTPPVEQWAPLSTADEKREVNAAATWSMDWELKGQIEAEKPIVKKRYSVASAKERWRFWSHQSSTEMTNNQLVY